MKIVDIRDTVVPIKSDIAKWGKLVKAAKIQPE